MVERSADKMASPIYSEPALLKKSIIGVSKYIRLRLRRRPLFLNLEVTRRCNAHCDFCNCWKEENSYELEDYLPIIKKFDPLVLSLTGGEPLLRKDIVGIVNRIKTGIPYIYINIITNGRLLSYNLARQLKDAGLDGLAISLNHLGKRHDEERGCPGLFQYITKLLPELSHIGFKNLSINTVIMNHNIDDLIPIARWASIYGISVCYSVYNSAKTNNRDYIIKQSNFWKLEQIIEQLIQLRRIHRNIVNSEWYLRNIKNYLYNGGIPECMAGLRWIHVQPDGNIKPCSELPAFSHWSDYDFKPPRIKCQLCWYACRGESETPLKPRRLIEIAMYELRRR
jgi:MoaA/NifB/PqqE/SkfB family radical SAM enzyme